MFEATNLNRDLSLGTKLFKVKINVTQFTISVRLLDIICKLFIT